MYLILRASIVRLRLSMMPAWSQLDGHLARGSCLHLLNALVLVVRQLFHSASFTRWLRIYWLSGLLIGKQLRALIRAGVT